MKNGLLRVRYKKNQSGIGHLSSHDIVTEKLEHSSVAMTCKPCKAVLDTVLPFLAIYRQIRDFRPRRGDSDLALAMDRQSPKIGDFEPQKLAKLAIFNINQRFRRFSLKICNFKTLNLEFSAKNSRSYFLFQLFLFCVEKNLHHENYDW